MTADPRIQCFYPLLGIHHIASKLTFIRLFKIKESEILKFQLFSFVLMNHNSFLAVISTTFPLNTRTKERPQI